ncbi:Clp protease N-terminal domain-containing protein [Rhodococcus opacus]|uniref:Clp protease N-terminal domain-containing protein n=1 Tax=Rhodococcus opacus TaxID=37919 RepID=UPI0029534CD4|nr:Clp protease N-terminal domain-containing protein [Rhodococcus opacus]
MVFERFSDQARQVVVLAAGAARTHHQNSVGTEHLLVGILDAGGPGAAALTSWGVTAPALASKLEGVRAPAGSAPAAGHIPITGEDEEGPRGQPAPDGPTRARRDRHRPPHSWPRSTTPPPPALKILTELSPLRISEMREHLRPPARPVPPPNTRPAANPTRTK